MENYELYPIIFKRRSIRNFDVTPLDDNTLTEISEYLQALTPIYADIKTDLKLVEPENVKRRMMRGAPHYIAAFSQPKDGYLTNIGFMLQQMDLFLSAKGLGSCWQGIPAPKKELLKSSNLEFVIFIAFGKSKELLHRKSLLGFKRKPLREITDIKGANELLEAARLAPSASNKQPWFFTGNENLIHAYAVKPGFIRAVVAKKYPFIDVGIALCHLKIAAEYFGKKTGIVLDKTAEMNFRKGNKYIASLKVS